MRPLLLLGSLGRGANRELIHRAATRFGAGADMGSSLAELPFFDPTQTTTPDVVRRLGQSIVRADSVFIVCPEYGHSLPGVLKNAIDWVIGSGELERKAVAITASVPSDARGLRGLAALRQTLNAVSAHVVWDQPVVRGTEDETLDRVQAELEAGARSANAERIVAYLHPTCSKSHEAAAWLSQRGLAFEVREYLVLPPNRAELGELLRALEADDPATLLRDEETVYAELDLAAASPEDRLEAITTHPELLQRPVVTYGRRAVVARSTTALARLFDLA